MIPGIVFMRCFSHKHVRSLSISDLVNFLSPFPDAIPLFTHNSSAPQTDRQTDGRTVENAISKLSLYYVTLAKIRYLLVSCHSLRNLRTASIVNYK